MLTDDDRLDEDALLRRADVMVTEGGDPGSRRGVHAPRRRACARRHDRHRRGDRPWSALRRGLSVDSSPRGVHGGLGPAQDYSTTCALAGPVRWTPRGTGSPCASCTCRRTRNDAGRARYRTWSRRWRCSSTSAWRAGAGIARGTARRSGLRFRQDADHNIELFRGLAPRRLGARAGGAVRKRMIGALTGERWREQVRGSPQRPRRAGALVSCARTTCGDPGRSAGRSGRGEPRRLRGGTDG